MIAKGCPKCDQQVCMPINTYVQLRHNKSQVPVACKACPCGYSFFNARRTARVSSPGEDMRRRTQRVRREKPNYYDVLEYDKHIKKVKKALISSYDYKFLLQIKLRNSECDNDEDYPGGKVDGRKVKRKRVKKEEEDEDEGVTNLTAEKQAQCSIILAELNRKMQLVMWKPS